MKIRILSLLLIALTLGACEDFLTRDPMDTVTDTPDFWNNEENIRTTMYRFYDVYFEGYRQGWERTDWYSETNIADWVDDNAQQEATFFTIAAPDKETDVASTKNDERNWTFSYVRELNLILNRVENSALNDETKQHWMGVTRFLRAMEYAKLVLKFGDVPYYTEVLENSDLESLYKPREARTVVMDKVLEDLHYAQQHVRTADGTAGVTINKAVVYAYTTRIMLFEGTWQKYHAKNNEYAIKYLKEVKAAADELISWNKYSLCDNYKDLTISEDLANNPEIIIYRSYVTGVVTHSLMSFQVTEPEINSPSKDLVDTYLSTNGLPIHQVENTEFLGDQWLADEMTNRDPRLSAIIDTERLHLKNIEAVFAISGYFGNRFVNDKLLDKVSTQCITDAPVMKLNEVLMNYIEAVAELSTLGQHTLSPNDFDKSINVIRNRKSTMMPHLKLDGSNLKVNGVIINDPNRDADVSSILWEIRRERRTELVYEGIRFNDLRRWGKLNYADMTLNTKLNLGAWLDKPRYVAWYNTQNPSNPITLETLSTITLDRAGNAGYIKPITSTDRMRKYANKDYLYPIPVDQIALYKTKGKELVQNPGW